MSATRLLVLGVVRGYGSAHGYLVGTDLVAWGADEWANVKWGSIYHALKQLTKEGCLAETLVPPARTDYQLTDKGEVEYLRLLRDSVKQPDVRPDMLGAGLALLPSLTREEAIGLLKQRLEALEGKRDSAHDLRESWGRPPHVKELFGLWEHTAASGVAWTLGLIGRLEAGDYPMMGEPDSPGPAGSWHDPSLSRYP